MRYRTALILALSLGAAASLAPPAAKAAGVYVGVGLPAPIYAPPAAACVPFAPGYYGAAPFCGSAYYGARYWGPRGYWGGYRYAHPAFNYRGWGGGWGARRRWR